VTISPETLRRLASIDTPTICNVIELFAVRPQNQGYTDQRIRAAFPELPPMVGFAATSSFRSAAPPDASSGYATFDRQIEHLAGLPRPSVVVVQDLDDPPVAAAFGEVLCSSYAAFGSAGLVTSGSGRDLAQVRAMEFAVFIGSTIGAHGYPNVMYLGQPVRVGGLMVHEGDLLHGDADGVTSIPPEIAADVPDAAAEYAAAEHFVIDYARGTADPTVTGYREAWAAFRAALDDLKRRVRGRDG
jgi:4-hydroxy-4-methyl-2-oxoglutarate aldolase